jgi:hypothetical protein
MLAGATATIAAGVSAPARPGAVFVVGTDIRGFFKDGSFHRVYGTVFRDGCIYVNPDWFSAPLELDIWKRGEEYELRARERGAA